MGCAVFLCPQFLGLTGEHLQCTKSMGQGARISAVNSAQFTQLCFMQELICHVRVLLTGCVHALEYVSLSYLCVQMCFSSIPRICSMLSLDLHLLWAATRNHLLYQIRKHIISTDIVLDMFYGFLS